MVDHKKVKDILLLSLAKGPVSTVVLREKFRKENLHFSKQAFYKALKKLLDEETIIKQGSMLSLSRQWILLKEKELKSISKSYRSNSFAHTVMDLQEGESLSYSVDSIKRLDLILLENLHHLSEKIRPKTVIIWSVREFFLLARPRQSEIFLEAMNEQKTLVLVAVEEPSEIDIIHNKKKVFQNKYSEFGVSCANPLPRKEFFSINVISDLVIEVVLGLKTRNAIEQLYSKSPKNEEVVILVNKILSIKDRHKVIVKRDKELARKVTKKISSNFILPVKYDMK